MIIRYISSDMIGFGSKPSPWKEIDADSEQVILSKFIDDEWVWDCDQCDDKTTWFGFSNGKYFKVYHDYYVHWGEPRYDGDNGFEVINNFDITEVSKEEAMPYLCSDRDWLTLPRYRW